ncbi:HLH domain-containing protein/bHLH-MYC_N domain-containing protein [Cephalotus follicularis]|uniref:HLH domain-containing protein/bHLH-MYC_N domain-containing protein n=1 Tax=Cephalotus follicularis TaxID=3775 RepID=A0A1Q3CUY7_CEPFO|nr:HLH domain-containing protein/bHLH-MYC_N domain-containing protein [Cephalotus follicularis]
MATLPESLKKQLALAVRSIQWSYAMFWSISVRQPGVLEWGDGYYNGDIKTRKTVQSMEINADQLGLQRSEQLRELYESLSVVESSPQARRPSASLSPEDLSDTEWYYLVCMSFVFNIGQGLPGRTLANGQPIWLCNAHYADSKVFSRSLLAKTVLCFPFLGGVIELGVTEKVLEDPSLIQHIKSSFLEIPYPRVYSNSNPDAIDSRILHTKLIPIVGCEELEMFSPDNSSNGFEANQLAEDSFVAAGIIGRASQVQSWNFMDDELSNCVDPSLNSSDCIFQTFVDPGMVVTDPKNDKVNSNWLQDVQECNHSKLTSLDIRHDDLHYQNVLSSLLKTSHQLILGQHFQNCNKNSNFVNWKKCGFENRQKRDGTAQKLLKKILFEVPQMHNHGLLESPEDDVNKDGVWRPEADGIGVNHVLSERKRRERINKKILTLKSICPSINKVDKVAILDDTIEYLQELERRVEELETCRDLTDLESRAKMKPQDIIERTSDNYGNDKTAKKPLLNKRKASDIDRMEPEIDYCGPKDNPTDNIIVNVIEKDVTIEIKCPWKDRILLEIMDAASNLHLDSHTVQSSNTDGILYLTIKSKYKGSIVPSVEMITQALQRVAWKC